MEQENYILEVFRDYMHGTLKLPFGRITQMLLARTNGKLFLEKHSEKAILNKLKYLKGEKICIGKKKIINIDAPSVESLAHMCKTRISDSE